MTTKSDTATAYRFFTEIGIIDQLISTKLESLLGGRITATQFGILNHLSRRPDGRTPLQVARSFQVPKTSMTHMLAGLDKAGFIVVTPNPADKRSKIVRLTAEGGQFLETSAEVIGADLGPTLSLIGIDAFTDALPHLQRIREALDQERDGPVDATRTRD